MNGDLAGARRIQVLRATGLLDSPPDPEFDEFTRLLARLLKAPVACVSLVDENRQFLKSAFGLEEPVATTRETPLSHSFCKHAVSMRRPLVVDDARVDPLVSENLAVRELGVVAYAGVPLTVEGEAVGALCAIDGRARHWTSDELDALSLLARAVERLIKLQVLNGELARRTSHLDTVLNSIGDALVVCDQKGQLELWNEAATELLGVGVPLPPEEWAKQYGLYLPDKVTPCPPELVPLSRALRGEHVEQELLFVRSPERPEGRWHSVNARPVRASDGTLEGAVTLGRDITELHEMQERLREASIRDSLTGLYNRRGFSVLADQAIKAAQRNAQKLALFFIDLNGMKEINDRLGHEQGDQALIATAEIMRLTFREMDALARLGGDEFVALTAAVPPDIATVLGDRLSANVLAQAKAHPERAFRLSISMGVSFYDPAEPRTVDQLLAEADSMMYQRKRKRQMSGSHVRIPG